MPVVALLVGHRGIDRGIVQVNQFLAGVALIVLGHRVQDGQAGARAVALGDVAKALVDGRLIVDAGAALCLSGRRHAETAIGDRAVGSANMYTSGLQFCTGLLVKQKVRRKT